MHKVVFQQPASCAGGTHPHAICPSDACTAGHLIRARSHSGVSSFLLLWKAFAVHSSRTQKVFALAGSEQLCSTFRCPLCLAGLLACHLVRFVGQQVWRPQSCPCHRGLCRTWCLHEGFGLGLHFPLPSGCLCSGHYCSCTPDTLVCQPSCQSMYFSPGQSSSQCRGLAAGCADWELSCSYPAGATAFVLTAFRTTVLLCPLFWYVFFLFNMIDLHVLHKGVIIALNA